jgi:hypothetical protein
MVERSKGEVTRGSAERDTLTAEDEDAVQLVVDRRTLCCNDLRLLRTWSMRPPSAPNTSRRTGAHTKKRIAISTQNTTAPIRNPMLIQSRVLHVSDTSDRSSSQYSPSKPGAHMHTGTSPIASHSPFGYEQLYSQLPFEQSAPLKCGSHTHIGGKY